MGTTPEGKVKKEVKKLLDAAGVAHDWPVQTGYGNQMLDCYATKDGFTLIIETKAPGEELTPRQRITARRYMDAGTPVVRVDGSPSTLELVKWWLAAVANAEEPLDVPVGSDLFDSSNPRSPFWEKK